MEYECICHENGIISRRASRMGRVVSSPTPILLERGEVGIMVHLHTGEKIVLLSTMEMVVEWMQTLAVWHLPARATSPEHEPVDVLDEYGYGLGEPGD